MNGLATSHRVHLTALLSVNGLAAGLWWAREQLWSQLFVFLWWNLFLAWVPWLFSTLICRKERSTFTFLCGALAWLSFFPNAPYLVTDLVHLRARPPVPLWFDVMLVASFSLAGLFIGISSLSTMHAELARRFGDKRAFTAVATVIVLTGYGVFLGRVEQLNTWDIVTKPSTVVSTVLSNVHELEAIGFTVAFSALMGAAYAFFHPNVFQPSATEHAREP